MQNKNISKNNAIPPEQGEFMSIKIAEIKTEKGWQEIRDEIFIPKEKELPILPDE